MTATRAAPQATLRPDQRCRLRISLPPRYREDSEPFAQRDLRSPGIRKDGPVGPAIALVRHIKGYTERFEPPAERLEIVDLQADVRQHASLQWNRRLRRLAEIEVDTGQIDCVVIRALTWYAAEHL